MLSVQAAAEATVQAEVLQDAAVPDIGQIKDIAAVQMKERVFVRIKDREAVQAAVRVIVQIQAQGAAEPTVQAIDQAAVREAVRTVVHVS